eukprot:6201854-Pleurochrysis_carterae.AAC.1
MQFWYGFLRPVGYPVPVFLDHWNNSHSPASSYRSYQPCTPTLETAQLYEMPLAAVRDELTRARRLARGLVVPAGLDPVGGASGSCGSHACAR